MTSDSDYYGMPENADGNGYETAVFEAKNTQKELLSDKDYMGISKNDVDKATSYEAIYNSVINDVNESLLDEREPTNSSTKVANGKDAIKITRERNDCNMKTFREANNYDKITSVPPSKQMVNMKHTKSEVESDRLDSVLVAEFNKNPYTQSLHSSF
jgi:inhibitor of KinA sporulation pathway (predicted exonuclease)